MAVMSALRSGRPFPPPHEDSWYSFVLEAESTPGPYLRLEGLGKLKKIHLIGTRTRDLPACSIVPQPTTLPRAPATHAINEIYILCCVDWQFFYENL
jgi:hypothetical protein